MARAPAWPHWAGVLAAPVIQITPLMGSNLIIVVFAVVVIGGMGSILGSILTGLALGLIEGLTKVFYPEASSIVVFVIMAIVLMIRPAGLFGKENRWAPRPTPTWRATASGRCTPASSLLLARAVHRAVPGVHDDGAVLRDLRVRVQPAASASPGCSRSGHAAYLGRCGLRDRLAREGGASDAGASGARRHAGVRAVRPGDRVDRDPAPGHLLRDGHARDAQMIYFVFLQAPFTGGEDGLQGVPRGKLFGLLSLADDRVLYYVVLAVFRGGVPVHHPDRAFTVRPGAEGDPRERAACHFARLRRRPLQAARVRAVDHAGRVGGVR